MSALLLALGVALMAAAGLGFVIYGAAALLRRLL